jgi:hypothetical protein
MPQIQTPSLTGFNNSIVVGQTKFDVQKFTDLNSIYSLYKKDSFTTYKGMIYLWNQRKLMNTPLISMAELQNSVMYVNGAEGKFRYSVPYDLGMPYVVEDMTGEIEKPGIDGQKFKIKLSENCFTNTDIITYDYRDGVTLYITEDEIYEESDGWVYTVLIPTADKKNYFPKRFLQPGTEYCKLTNVNGEYDTQKSSIFLRQGSLDLEMQIGGGRSVYHWITAYADMMKVDGGDPRYQWMNQYGDLRRNNSTLVFFNKDQEGNRIPGSTKWMNRIEAMLFAEMKMMEERDLMWNKGGIVQGSGRRSVRVNTGLYEQMRNGNRVQYTTLTLSLIEEMLSNLFYNSGIPFEQRRTKIMLGTGAMIEVSKLLADDFKNTNPFLVQAGDVKGYLYGTAMNLGFGYRFTSKRFPVAGEVIFEYNPALDNRYNRVQDGLIGEFPIESYTLMIMDITDGSVSNAAGKPSNVEYRVEDGFNSSSNIVLLKPEGWGDTYWGYEVGTQHPLGASATKGMYSSSQRDGYAIWMKNQSSIWLKDATRSVIIEKVKAVF